MPTEEHNDKLTKKRTIKVLLSDSNFKLTHRDEQMLFSKNFLFLLCDAKTEKNYVQNPQIYKKQNMLSFNIVNLVLFPLVSVPDRKTWSKIIIIAHFFQLAVSTYYTHIYFTARLTRSVTNLWVIAICQSKNM